MKLRSLAIGSVAGLAATALTAGAAGATTVAAWDFSQFAGANVLATDNAGTQDDTIDSNYSDLDPNSLGTESAQYGTMFLNGDFGSTDTPLDFGATDPFTPSGTDLAVNNDVLDDPQVFLGSGGSLNVLTAEGQPVQNFLAMAARDTSTVVFGADLNSIPEFGQGWTLSFGGLAPQQASNVLVEFSPDGQDFTSLDPVGLTTSPAVYSRTVASASGDRAFFRLTFNDNVGGANQPTIDNVGISTALVPEPGTALLLGSGLAGLAGFGRRSRRG